MSNNKKRNVHEFSLHYETSYSKSRHAEPKKYDFKDKSGAGAGAKLDTSVEAKYVWGNTVLGSYFKTEYPQPSTFHRDLMALESVLYKHNELEELTTDVEFEISAMKSIDTAPISSMLVSRAVDTNDMVSTGLVSTGVKVGGRRKVKHASK